MTNRKASKAGGPQTPSAPQATKKDQVIALLRRDGGATLPEITEASGWLAHSARAVLTGLRKNGYSIERTRADGVTRWLITAVPA